MGLRAVGRHQQSGRCLVQGKGAKWLNYCIVYDFFKFKFQLIICVAVLIKISPKCSNTNIDRSKKNKIKKTRTEPTLELQKMFTNKIFGVGHCSCGNYLEGWPNC